MTQDDAQLREEAAGWLLRQRDPARADWIAFTDWLAADPAHNAAYEAVALADADYAALVATAGREAMFAGDRAIPDFANDNPPRTGRAGRRLFGMAGAAAAAAIALLAYPMLVPATASYALTTAAGEHRLVTLGDGTRIEMNGGTRLTLRKGDDRFASLDAGEASFTVVHDSARPFELVAGDTRLRDVGTVFDVVRSGNELEAAVAEGAVLYDPDGQALRLGAGQTIRVSADKVAVGRVDPAAVGAWRQGRLVYRDAPLDRVASDLARNLGMPVTLADGLAAERFSGVIRLDEQPSRLFARIGALLDVQANRAGNGWRLTRRTRDAR